MKAQGVQEDIPTFFRSEPGFTRLFTLFIKKYASLGRAGGSIKLEKLSHEEAGSLSAFFRRNYMPTQSVAISFTDFCVALEQTRFAGIHVLDFLSAYQGRPLLTNEQVARRKQRKKDKFFNKFLEEYPQILCQKWLGAIRDKLPGTRRVHLAYEQDVLGLERNMVVVLTGIANLPESYERLPLFARRISGDPHILDSDTETGRLFLDALRSIAEEKEFSSGEEVAVRSTVEEDNELLYAFGLLRDDLLNFVTCMGLLAVEKQNGKEEEVPYWRQAWQDGVVLNIPLREMLKVQYLYPSIKAEKGAKHVFIVENSGVFSSLADIFSQQGLALPPLLCMHGQFKLACWAAIERLVAGGCTIWYSGDFDPEGLFIAQRLLTRYPDSVKLWRYSLEDYAESLSEVSLPAERLNKLSTIRCLEFADLVEKIREVGRAGYQEGLVEKLALDMKRCIHDTPIHQSTDIYDTLNYENMVEVVIKNIC